MTNRDGAQEQQRQHQTHSNIGKECFAQVLFVNIVLAEPGQLSVLRGWLLVAATNYVAPDVAFFATRGSGGRSDGAA